MSSRDDEKKLGCHLRLTHYLLYDQAVPAYIIKIYKYTITSHHNIQLGRRKLIKKKCRAILSMRFVLVEKKLR